MEVGKKVRMASMAMAAAVAGLVFTAMADGERPGAAGDAMPQKVKTVVDEKLGQIHATEYRNIYTIGVSLLKEKHYPSAATLLKRLENEKNSEFIDDALRDKITEAMVALKKEQQRVSKGEERTVYQSFMRSAAAKKIYEEHLQRYNAKVIDESVKEYLELVTWCKKNDKHNGRVKEIAELILKKDSNHEEARKLLGHVKVETFGWVEGDAVEKIKQGLARVGDKWLSKGEIAKRKGQFTTRFYFQGAMSSRSFILERLAHRKSDGSYSDHSLKIQNESYSVVVPKNYDGKEKFGLFVFIAPGNGGNCARHWIPILEKHKMIYIGANGSGNRKHVLDVRMPLAMAAVFNMKLRYNIDDSKVIISGLSGGGRVASMLAPVFPDVFRGAFYMVGCNPLSPRQLPKDEKLLDLVKTKSRFVLQTGDKDFNNKGTRMVQKNYQQLGFKNTYFYSIPKHGHRIPNNMYFDKSLLYLLTGAKPDEN